jgi:hypothetical protein
METVCQISDFIPEFLVETVLTICLAEFIHMIPVVVGVHFLVADVDLHDLKADDVMVGDLRAVGSRVKAHSDLLFD